MLSFHVLFAVFQKMLSRNRYEKIVTHALSDQCYTANNGTNLNGILSCITHHNNSVLNAGFYVIKSLQYSHCPVHRMP